MTPISLSGVDGYLLGPLATDPFHRGKGAGRRLVEEVSKLALNRDEGEYVLLVGDQAYYAPMGFVPTKPGAIIFPGPVDPTRVLVYSADLTHVETLNGPISGFSIPH